MAVRRSQFFAGGHVLDPHRVTPDRRWQGVSTVYVYPKECNERAGQFLLDNFGPDSGRDATLVRLVHGYYSPNGLPFATQHAWVDLATGVVFDGVLQGFYAAAGYAEVYRTEEVVRYTCGEAARLMSAHEHWGPWHPAVRAHRFHPSALPEPNAYVVIGGRPRRGAVGAAQGADPTAVVLLTEDVGPVGADHYLAGDQLFGRRAGEHRGMPLYEPAAPGDTESG